MLRKSLRYIINYVISRKNLAYREKIFHFKIPALKNCRTAYEKEYGEGL